MTAPISLDDFNPAPCGNPDCVCGKPSRWRVCEEWMGIDETGEFCPRCGWTRRCHPSPSAIACATSDGSGALCRTVGPHEIHDFDLTEESPTCG